MYRFIPPLIVLVPQDSNVALHAQGCLLYCVLFRPLGSSGQTMVSISSVAGISKIFCTSEVASATRT